MARTRRKSGEVESKSLLEGLLRQTGGVPPTEPRGGSCVPMPRRRAPWQTVLVGIVAGGLVHCFGREGALAGVADPQQPAPAAPSAIPVTSPEPTPSTTALYAEARRYLDAKDYAQALPRLQRAAAAGNADAMCGMGWLYQHGQGVTPDDTQAHQWYLKAAEAGNAEAMFRLGVLYSWGAGVPQDYAKAREWFQKGANAGNTDAICGMGWLYQSGHGRAEDNTQDYVKARAWFQKAADAGNTDAMVRLSELYALGIGVTQDDAQAREWYQKAADAGNTEAMVRLGRLHEGGHVGVPQDYAKARAWYQKAADAGNAEAAIALAHLQAASPSPAPTRLSGSPAQPDQDEGTGTASPVTPGTVLEGEDATQVAAFVTAFVRAGGSDSEVDSGKYYTPVVTYNHVDQTRDAMVNDDKAYWSKWPVRRYAMLTPPLVLSTDSADVYRARYRVAFSVQNRTKRVEGDASYEVLVHKDGGKLLIRSLTEQIDRRSVTSLTK